jgi:predicted molibdopterin-dependent oxidoreductase YjgC
MIMANDITVSAKLHSAWLRYSAPVAWNRVSRFTSGESVSCDKISTVATMAAMMDTRKLSDIAVMVMDLTAGLSRVVLWPRLRGG